MYLPLVLNPRRVVRSNHTALTARLVKERLIRVPVCPPRRAHQMSICQCKVDAKGSITPGSPASPAEVDNMHPSGRVDAGRIGRSVFEIKNVSLGSRLKGPFFGGATKMVPELAFDWFRCLQRVLTHADDGTVWWPRIDNRILMSPTTGTRSHTSSFLAHIMRTSGPKPSIIGAYLGLSANLHRVLTPSSAELNRAAWTPTNLSRPTRRAASVYKGNGPTKILMLVKGRVQYHVTQFKIPGGVLNILDLTSIITSKRAMVLCARVALMNRLIHWKFLARCLSLDNRPRLLLVM
ncbi:hypothetical protein B0H14DRAFT_2612052 [Mycena olivaceomarginata]|nr:hypothetical protein B0H14DRAFT_2612052 [Mycena olivaceomarginata]